MRQAGNRFSEQPNQIERDTINLRYRRRLTIYCHTYTYTVAYSLQYLRLPTSWPSIITGSVPLPPAIHTLQLAYIIKLPTC